MALTRARVAADFAAKEAYESYKGDQVLAGLPVPRVVVKDVNLTLRFVVNEDQRGAFDAELEAAASKEWASILSRELVDLLSTPGRVGDAKLGEALTRSARELEASARTEFHLSGAFASASGVARVVRATLEYLGKVGAAVPQKLAPGVLKGSRLKAHAQPRVERLLESSTFRLKEIATARAALARKFDISITNGVLAKAAQNSVHEIKLTLGTDDLRVVAPDTSEG